MRVARRAALRASLLRDAARRVDPMSARHAAEARRSGSSTRVIARC